MKLGMQSFHFDTSFEVTDAVALRNDLTRLRGNTAVVIDFRDVQLVTETAIDALAAALRSITGHRVFALGFEGIGVERFRALGVVCC
jgi:hypothetical protein